MPLTSISQVIAKLDYIIHWSKINKSALGYFPALYQRTTIEVERAIDNGFFDNPEKMKILDIKFAEFYLRAFEGYMRREKSISKSWKFAFDATQDNRLTVIQHLLLGMNAHINLDLGISVANLSTPENIHLYKKDFYRINFILASLIDQMQNMIAEVWGSLKYLDIIFGRLDEYLISYLLSKFRDQAWKIALELVTIKGEERRQRYIRMVDKKVHNYAKKVGYPLSAFFNPLLYSISMKERKSVVDIIDILHHAEIYSKW